MEYAGGGNLHNYLENHFTNIKWITKLTILCQISDGGNILKDDHKKWVIGDLGLSQPADNSSNNGNTIVRNFVPTPLPSSNEESSIANTLNRMQADNK
ncbi:hypothetical protein C1646_815740 [Rhizophagus diaphanus]|nr:hypothetical protein C1646_815740 [Rhizophagus diaphanus] [Rhizophagus sp. MUCL 43196]